MKAAIRRDGHAVIHGPTANGGGWRVPVALPAGLVAVLAALMSGLPRGFEDVAVAPGDFDRELDIEGITDPSVRILLHRLRRAWVVEMRSIRADRAEKK